MEWTCTLGLAVEILPAHHHGVVVAIRWTPSLQSLQERDPRAYQLYFAPGGSGPPFGTSGPAFLGCTPERLYARTGRWVSSEAVAGTRPRGRGGDVEQVGGKRLTTEGSGIRTSWGEMGGKLGVTSACFCTATAGYVVACANFSPWCVAPLVENPCVASRC